MVEDYKSVRKVQKEVDSAIVVLEQQRDKSSNVIGSSAHEEGASFKTHVGAPPLRVINGHAEEFDEEEVVVGELPELFEKRQECPHCQVSFTSPQALEHHMSTFVRKEKLSWISENFFDRDKHMTLVCPILGCCDRFFNLSVYWDHLRDEHRDGTDFEPNPGQVPIYQDGSLDYNEVELNKCYLCGQLFTRPHDRDRHVKKCQGRVVFNCDMCTFISADYEEVTAHSKNHSIENTGFVLLHEFKELARIDGVDEESYDRLTEKTAEYRQAIKSQRGSRDIFVTYTKPFPSGLTSLQQVFSDVNQQLLEQLLSVCRNKNQSRIGFQIILPCVASKIVEVIDESGETVGQGHKTYRHYFFRTSMFVINNSGDTR